MTDWNSVFAYAALEMGMGVELCWPYQARQKGSVENLVRYVKSSFFKVRSFHDEEDLQATTGGVASGSETGASQPGDRSDPRGAFGEEASRLRALKVRPENLALRIAVTSDLRGRWCMMGMPTRCLRKPSACPRRCTSMPTGCGSWLVDGRRCIVGNCSAEGSTLAEQRAALVAAVSGKRGKRYLKRQQLLDLGEPMFLYLTEIVHRRPKEWISEVDRLYDILERHGSEVLLQAVERGLQEQIFSAVYVERFLQRSFAFEEVNE